MKISFTTIMFCFFVYALFAQEEVVYKEKKNGYYQDSILPSLRAYQNELIGEETGRYLSLDFSGLDLPTHIGDYTSHWHGDPLSQGATGTCWCFATISFLESEAYRISGMQVKLSEMYIVYWEYVARARYFVENRGDMYFGQGSEANGVTRAMKQHGLVPASQYPGIRQGQKFHDHGPMEEEIRSYLEFIKSNNIWDEEAVVSNVKSILNHSLGKPPEFVSVKGEKISPMEYMRDLVGLNPDDYFCFMSTKSLPYNQKGELKEPDNWWHSDAYYNVTLSDFSSLLLAALDQGYTLSVCGDVSEPGYDRYEGVGIIPSWDIPNEYIDEHARELRLYNGSTTDDHCIHVVGHAKHNGEQWYLIKDSSAGAFDGLTKGYKFIREDYVRLKIMALMTHKYAAREILDRIIK